MPSLNLRFMRLFCFAITLVISSFHAHADELKDLNEAANSQGDLTEAQLTRFLHSHFSRAQPLTIKPDPQTGEISPDQVITEQVTREKLIAAQTASEMSALKTSDNPAKAYFLKTGFFKKDDIASEVLNLPDPSAAQPKPEPPKQTPGEILSAYYEPQVFFSARKSASLLDSDFVVSQDSKKKPALANLPSDSGALLSYNRNFTVEQNTWTAQGSLGLPVRFPFNSSGVQEIWFVPSVDFNHLGGSAIAPSKRIDNLAWRTGIYVRDFTAATQGLQFRVGNVTQTDFRFSSLIVGGESEIEFKNETLHLGVPIAEFKDEDQNPRLNITPRLILNLDGGTVVDAGYKTTLSNGQDYSRFGPVASLTFSQGSGLSGAFRGILPTSVRVSYAHYLGLVGGAYDDYGVVGIWNIDGSGVFSLNATYDHGGLNPNGDKANQFTVGLTIKK
jgi:hypothetical protein